VGEALTGAHAGQPSSSEITSPGVPTLYGEGEGHIRDGATREPRRNATEPKTLGMRGNSLHGNRETPKVSAVPNAYQADGGAERPEKALGRTSGMHAYGESDGSIVPKKQATRPKYWRRSLWREGGRPRGTTCQPGTCRTQSRVRVGVDGGAYEKSNQRLIVT